jgi:hypothetical protein
MARHVRECHFDLTREGEEWEVGSASESVGSRGSAALASPGTRLRAPKTDDWPARTDVEELDAWQAWRVTNNFSETQSEMDKTNIAKFLAFALGDKNPKIHLIPCVTSQAILTEWRAKLQNHHISRINNYLGPLRNFLNFLATHAKLRKEERELAEEAARTLSSSVASERRVGVQRTISRNTREALEESNQWIDIDELKNAIEQGHPRFLRVVKSTEKPSKADYQFAMYYCIVLASLTSSTLRGGEWAYIDLPSAMLRLNGGKGPVKVTQFKNDSKRPFHLLDLDDVTARAWRLFLQLRNRTVPDTAKPYLFVTYDGKELARGTAQGIKALVQELTGDPTKVVTATTLRKVVETHVVDTIGPETPAARAVIEGHDHSTSTSGLAYQKQKLATRAQLATKTRADIGLRPNVSFAGSDEEPQEEEAKQVPAKGKEKRKQPIRDDEDGEIVPAPKANPILVTDDYSDSDDDAEYDDDAMLSQAATQLQQIASSPRQAEANADSGDDFKPPAPRLRKQDGKTVTKSSQGKKGK